MKTANKIIMTIAGAILIIASILKAHQLLTEPIISTGFWESWLFFVIQIPLELGLGIWLLCGLFRKAAWIVGVLSFGFFILITLHKGITGAASCGCFGTVHVNPWITLFAIDAPLFVLFAIFRPKGEKLLPPPWPSAKHFFGVAIPTFILLPVIVLILAFNKPPLKTDKYEVLDPEQWEAETDRQWCLFEYIDIADSLKSDVIIVLLYHDDCPDCREAIPLYDSIAKEQLIGNDEIRFAFIEAPPYGDQADSPVPDDTPCLTGRLNSSKNWIFATPLVVLLQDGFVIKIWQATAPPFEEILETALTSG